ncbi:MAG: VOC family protein [Candidatus Eremiobacteraeota bacterium]|nr:VOC family protein [Candidatus Eremiobacteraeota bacterium]
MPRAIAFYRDVLGLQPITESERGAEYEFDDGSTFGLWPGFGPQMPFQPSNGVLFAVDDFDAAIAAVKGHGVEILLQHDSASCFLAVVGDTEGNTLTLHKRKKT